MSKSFGSLNTVQNFQEDSTTGNTVPQISTGGAAHVIEKADIQTFIDNTGTYLYTGYAPYGVLTSAAGTQIFRQEITAGGLGAKLRADGNLNFDNVWDNRAALSYS